jgi:gliding motility-associated protein GldE
MAETAIYIVVLALLLITSAIISAAKQQALSSEEVKRLGQNRTLATMQVADVFVNTAVAILVALTLLFIIECDKPTVGLLAVVVTLILLFAVRFYSRKRVVRKAPKLLLRLSFLTTALHPFSSMLLWAHKKQNISIDDLSDALEKTSELSENENILKGIVKFGHSDVHTIMTPRIDVVSVDVGTGLTELIAKINECGYSRMPVYDSTPDNVKGILYVKDLLPYLEESDGFRWQELIRSAYFVPEHKKIDNLLNKFQEMKIHVAVIIDEYGGMVGIVTLEDILEEIVGEIADESDDDEQFYVKIDEHTYLFDGKVLLNDFFRILHLDEADFDAVRGEADTLAGVILEMKGEIPQKGDCMEFKQFSFIVDSVDNRRIKQIKVTIHE